MDIMLASVSGIPAYEKTSNVNWFISDEFLYVSRSKSLSIKPMIGKIRAKLNVSEAIAKVE